MKHLARLMVDESGKSYFKDDPLPESVLHKKFPVATTELFTGSEVVHWHSGPLQLKWVNAPQRQCFIYLGGAVEMTAGSGETRKFVSGNILMVEDTTGTGHCTHIADYMDAIVIKYDGSY